MAAGIPDGREVLVSRLQRQLGTLVSSVKIAGQNNLSSSHVVAETTLAGLLNRVYGWELGNANAIRQNCPGVDLIDEGQKIAVQVTATRSVEKVQHTLKEVGKSGIVYNRLILLLLTDDKPTPGMLSCTVPTYSGPMEIWNIPDVFRAAKELDVIRLEGLTKYMEAELGSIRDRVKELPHLELPPTSVLGSTGFVGRQEELAEIRSRFAQNDPLVVLTGLGGMGKTELAVRYGQEHFGLSYFVRFDTSFTRTLSKMVQGIRPKLTEEELRLDESILIRRVLTMLERSGSDDVLIIDNVDSDTASLIQLQQDPVYKQLLELPLKLLITTRSDVPRAVHIQPMAEESLFDIFRNHDAELTEAQMRKLIRAVNRHTLTVDLIARTLADNWVPVSPEEMLDAIANTTLREEDFPEVGTDYNGDPEQLHIYQRLRSVFQVAKVPPMEQQLLRLATLLPEAGMDVRLFRSALTDEQRRAFPVLGKRGWLSAEHKILTIHPVIRLVCRTELEIAEADCEGFLDSLWAQFDQKVYDPTRYGQMAELFTAAHDQLGQHHGRWLNRSGIILNVVAQHQALHDLYHTRLPALERILPPDSLELASAYNYYGISLGGLGDYSSALAYGEKALNIQKAQSTGDSVELAYSYTNVGVSYGDLGQHQLALELQLKALELLQRLLPLDHPDLAASYNHISITYGDMGKHQKALDYNQKALAIQERVLPPDHPNLATSYDNVGSTYGYLGQHQLALEYQQKALAIREKVLTPDHPNLAASYINVGSTYSDLGKHQLALEYNHKALAILEKVLTPDHPDLALSYNNVGSAYGYLDKHQLALEYKQKALTIQEKVLTPDHPDLALSYNNVGLTYGDLGKHQKALEFLLKSLAIWEKVLPQDHPNLATSCNNIAWTAHTLGDLPTAARFMRRAADIIGRSSLPKTHPDRISFPKLAGQFEAEAKLQEAIRAQQTSWGIDPFDFLKK